MENRNYCVYCHTNKQNGKKYIGITCQNPEQRWRNGYGYQKCRRFWNAISCYGWDAFTHEIWYTDLTKEEAEVLEIELIAKYETQNPLKGYNILAGGNGTAGFHHTEEARKKISEAGKGRHHTEESRKKISESHKGVPKAKEAIIAQRKASGYYPIKCLETGVIYYAVKEAAKFAGVKTGTITNCCLGKLKTAGGFRWQRVTWEEYEAQEAQKGGDTNARCETNYERKTPESD